MLLEQLDCVIAETSIQVLQVARRGGVGSQLEHSIANRGRFDLRRVIRGRQQDGLDLGDQPPVGLGLFPDLLPFGISEEALPRRGLGFCAGKGQHVDQLVIRVFDGRPVANVRQAVLLEQFERVVTEASLEIIESVGGCVVGPHLEDSCVWLFRDKDAGQSEKHCDC